MFFQIVKPMLKVVQDVVVVVAACCIVLFSGSLEYSLLLSRLLMWLKLLILWQIV